MPLNKEILKLIKEMLLLTNLTIAVNKCKI